MEIRYRPHAVERMFQRKITPGMVDEIIKNSDGIIKQSKDKFIYYKYFNKRKDNNIAAVTVHIENKIYEIITVMVNFEDIS